MLNTFRFSLWCALYLIVFSLSSYAEIGRSDTECLKNIQQTDMQTLYAVGNSALEAKNFSEAIRKFQLLNFKYPDHPYQENVQLYLIYCLQGEKKYEDAMKAADLFIQKYPESNRCQDVLAFKKVLERQNTQKKTDIAAKAFLMVTGVSGCIGLFFIFGPNSWTRFFLGY